MQVTNEYPGSHYYEETWELETNWCCPYCGIRGSIWTALGGDFYAGCESMCTECGHSFYLQSGPQEIKEPNSLGILQQLRSGKKTIPTTRRA
jgi:rubredoxin